MFIGVDISQWAIIATLLAGSVVVAYGLRIVLASLIKYALRKSLDFVPSSRLLNAVARSLALMIVAELDVFALRYVQLSKAVVAKVDVVLDTAAIIFVTIAVYQFVELVCSRTVGWYLRNREHGTDIAATLAPLIASLLRILVVIFGVSFALGILGVNVAAIIAGLSIGGAALALASQDTVKNLFGSAILLTERPFVVGDWITTQGIEGVVEEIGFRSTRIRTFSDTVVFVANAKMADSNIENVQMRNMRRFKSTLQLDLATSSETIEKFIADIRKFLAADPSVSKAANKIVVNVSSIGQQGIGVLVVCWYSVNAEHPEPAIVHRINLGILLAAQAHGARLTAAYDRAVVQTENGQ